MAGVFMVPHLCQQMRSTDDDESPLRHYLQFQYLIPPYCTVREFERSPFFIQDALAVRYPSVYGIRRVVGEGEKQIITIVL